MNKTLKQILKLTLTSIFLISFLTSCSTSHKNVSDSISGNFLLKGLTGSNDFESLVETLVVKSEKRFNKYLTSSEPVLVSDFVNIKNYKNPSKLGFLLSEQLKDSLLNRDIIVKQVEVGREFQLGPSGFNLLTRNQSDILNKDINSEYAVVGTYSITSENLIVFLKLINITNGNILSSSSVRTKLDGEILDLERRPKSLTVYAPPSI